MSKAARPLLLLFLALLFCAPSWAQFSSTARHIVWGTTTPAKCNPATGDVFFKTSATITVYYCSALNVWSAFPTTSGLLTYNQPLGAGFSTGSSSTPLTAGVVSYRRAFSQCTIAGYSAFTDQGTESFDVWKIATGTALPTVANTIISGASYLAVSSGTAASGGTGSFTTTTVSAGDILAFKLQALSSSSQASVEIQCNAF